MDMPLITKKKKKKVIQIYIYIYLESFNIWHMFLIISLIQISYTTIRDFTS